MYIVWRNGQKFQNNVHYINIVGVHCCNKKVGFHCNYRQITARMLYKMHNSGKQNLPVNSAQDLTLLKISLPELNSSEERSYTLSHIAPTCPYNSYTLSLAVSPIATVTMI